MNIEYMLKELKREVHMRKKVYGKKVLKGEMSENFAQAKIKAMQDAYTLISLAAAREWQKLATIIDNQKQGSFL